MQCGISHMLLVKMGKLIGLPVKEVTFAVLPTKLSQKHEWL